jgi:hypothetical protein
VTRETPAQVVARIAADTAAAVEGLRAEVAQLRTEIAALRAEQRSEPEAAARVGSWAWLGVLLDDPRIRVVVLTIAVTAGSSVVSRVLGDQDADRVAREVAAALRSTTHAHEEDTDDVARPDP